MKWINSTDESVRNQAPDAFSKLLEGGKSYKEYLNNQIAGLQQLQNEGKITAEQLENLHKLTTALQDESSKTVMSEWEKGLQTELNNARSVLEMLNIIEKKREALKNDNSGLVEQKTIILDKQEESINEKAEDEAREALKQYSDYLDKKINRKIAHDSQIKSLQKLAKKAETDEEREKINALIKLQEKLYDAQIDSFEELEQINIDSIYRYGTHEQKKLQITKEYQKLINAALATGQKDIAKKLEGERDLEILKETKQYKDFFGDISEISIKTLENTRRVLLSIMKEAYTAGKLTAEEYKKLIDEINKQADSAYKGRGMESIFGNSKSGGMMNMLFGEGDFESKISSFKTLFSGAKGDMASMAGTSGEVAGNAGEAAGAMQGAAGGAAGALSIVDAIIKAVYQTLRAVSDTLNVIADYQDSIGHSDAADTLGDWANTINAVNETAMSGWENLKSGNVMGAISDTISMPFKLLTTLNGIHDKHIDKDIQRHAEAVRDLSNAYNQLEWQINKALGEAVYKNQKAAIDNMRQQQVQLSEMARLEAEKKKADGNKITEYEEQYAELGRQIEDMIADIASSITQTTAKDLANQLADALVEAYGKGEDAAKSFEEVSRKVMQNAVKNALKLQFLEEPLQDAIKRLQNDMGFDSEGNGSFNGLTQAEQDRFKSAVDNISRQYDKAMEVYKDLFKDIEDDPTTSLSGAIKGASQESIDLLAGQTNAVRVNQVQGIEIMRNSLIQLTMINANTDKSSKYLENIDSKISSTYDFLRSQGIIGG